MVNFTDLIDALMKEGGEMPSKEALAAVLQTAQKVIDDQAVEIHHLRKQLFGRKSERVVEGQQSLFADALEEVAQRVPEPEPESDEEAEASKKRRKKKRDRRKPLEPTRTVTVLVPEEDRPCPECGKERCSAGHTRKLIIEYTPPKFEVTEYLSEVIVCRPCEGEVQRAVAPSAPKEGSWPGPRLLGTLITNKAVDGLPLRRSQKIFKRYGADFAISTLSRWEGFAHELLAPLTGRITELVRSADIINLDDTSIRVRDASAEGGVVNGKFWVFVGLKFDPSGDLRRTREYVAYAYAPNWEAVHPEEWLKGSRAALQGDAYRGYERIAAQDRGDHVGRLLAGCCMHARRPFTQALETGDQAARPFVDLFRRIYRLEEAAKEKALTAEQRLEFRRAHSCPLMEEILSRARELSDMPLLKPLKQGVTYVINQREKLMVPFEVDGRFEIDNGIAERRLRRIAAGRKAWLFAGSRGGAERFADILSIVSTADAAGVDCGKYLPSVIENISAWPNKRLDELLPHNWQTAFEKYLLEQAAARR